MSLTSLPHFTHGSHFKNLDECVGKRGDPPPSLRGARHVGGQTSVPLVYSTRLKAAATRRRVSRSGVPGCRYVRIVSENSGRRRLQRQRANHWKEPLRPSCAYRSHLGAVSSCQHAFFLFCCFARQRLPFRFQVFCLAGGEAVIMGKSMCDGLQRARDEHAELAAMLCLSCWPARVCDSFLVENLRFATRYVRVCIRCHLM